MSDGVRGSIAWGKIVMVWRGRGPRRGQLDKRPKGLCQITEHKLRRQNQSAKPKPSKGSEIANDSLVYPATSRSAKLLTSRNLIPHYALRIPN